MSGLLVLIRMGLYQLDGSEAFAYFESSREALRAHPGFRGAALMRDVNDPNVSLAMFEYASPEDANAGLRIVAERRLLDEDQEFGYAPADVMRLKILSATGCLDGRVEDARYLSLSVRVAEPGYGSELGDELVRIFQELAFLPGFTGSLVGSGEALEEEIFGLAAWDSQAAFESSLPTQMPYQVKLYARQA